jgi:hypothetical protein
VEAVVAAVERERGIDRGTDARSIFAFVEQG